jgi:WD40 repeat protein
LFTNTEKFISFRWRPIYQGLALILVWQVVGYAKDTPTYRGEIRAIFKDHCSSCHNPDKKKGDLNLLSYQGLMQGSGSGEIINKGSPMDSILYNVMTHAAEPTMPPKKDKCDDEVLDLIKKWIEAGAPDSDADSHLTSQPSTPVLLPKRPVQKSINSTLSDNSYLAWPLNPIGKLPQRGSVIGSITQHTQSPIMALEGLNQALLVHSPSGNLLGAIPFKSGRPTVLRFTPSGQHLLMAGGEGAHSGDLILWDLQKGLPAWTWDEEVDQILGADVSPDLSLLALGGPSKVLKIIDTAKRQILASIHKHTDWITQCTYSPDGILLASSDRNGNLYIWEAESKELLYDLSGHKKSITGLAWSSDSNTLGSISEDGDFKLWDMKKGRLLKSMRAHESGGLSLTFQNSLWITTGRDQRVICWDTAGKRISSSKVLDDLPTAISADFEGNIWVGFLMGEAWILNPRDNFAVEQKIVTFTSKKIEMSDHQ